MRIGLFASSLFALSFALSGCEFRTVPATGEGNQSAAEDAAPQQVSWNDAAAKELRDAIGNRAAHGLDRVSFEVPQGGDAEGLTRAALAYAGALAHGATDPTKLYEVYTLPRPNPDLRTGLAQALQQGKLGAWLNSLAPQDDNYQRLSKAYLALRKPEGAPSPAVPDSGEPIEPSATDPRVPVIARQLVALGYLDGRAPAGDRYTPALAVAVKRMQADYGIKPDGVIGGGALTVLNMSDANRAAAIAANMERLRWLERQPPATRVDVNVAAARLSYFRDGQLVDSRKVVVGEPDRETPQLGSPMFQLVANPTWTVPKGIAAEEITPKGPGYLKANNMVWKDGYVVQQPGPKNSLGLVKFDMKNEHAIYLHDTPAKPLFNMVQRQRSHGCVRVEDALGFAQMIAQDEGVLDQWNQARATGKETFVKLPREIPVRLLYQTVLFGEDGEPIVRNDPYGWNDRVATALGFPAGASPRVKPEQVDVGP